MKLPVILSAIISVGVIAGGVYSLDATYARDSQLCKVEQRLDRKILSDDMMRLQQRQWRLKDRYGEDEAVRLPEYRELEQQREMILRELER
jgi:hypothetical protein